MKSFFYLTIQSRSKKGKASLFIVFLSLTVFLFSCTIISAHHHNDGHDHDDCVLCIDQSMSSRAETVFALEQISFINIGSIDLCYQFYTREFKYSSRSRAPPPLVPLS